MQPSTNNLSFSNNGNYLAVSSLAPSNDLKYHTRIFDIGKKSYIKSSILGLRNSVFVTLDNEEYIIGIENDNAYTSIVIYKFGDLLENKVQKLISYRLDIFDEPYSISFLSENKFAVLHKNNGLWTISVIEQNFQNISQLNNNAELIFQNEISESAL